MADPKTTELQMSGGQAPKDGESSLDQPNDAVAMKDLPQPTSTEPESTSTKDSKDAEPPIPTPEKDSPNAPLASEQSDDAIEPSLKGKEKEPAPPPLAKLRQDSLAIGPSVDTVQPVTPSGSDGPVCNITLLLTTGARHPYRIDEKYLTKRNVAVPGLTEAGKKDPFTISVYTLKELILREWRDEWDAKPASPSSIRLIHFGKLLDDKDQLKQYHFSSETANVVHMTVRPADIVEEEEPKGGNKSSSGGGRNRDGGGGCCVIL